MPRTCVSIRTSSTARAIGYLALAALGACHEHSPVQPQIVPAPPDTTPPRLNLRLVVVDDTTARVQGSVTDDGKVLKVLWEVRGFAGGSLNFTPAKQVAVDLALPSRPWIGLLVFVYAYDSAGHSHAWSVIWTPGPRSLGALSTQLPASDTLRQPGLEFTTSVSGPAAIREMYVLVDPGTAAERKVPVTEVWYSSRPLPSEDYKRVSVVIPPTLPNGSHSFRVVVVDATGAVVDTSFHYVVRVPGVSYQLRYLGTLGGVDSHARGLSSTGQACGDAADPSGTIRAFAWRGGAIEPLATGDSGESSAIAIDSRGEAVGTARLDQQVAGVAWGADGTMRRLESGGYRLLQVIDLNDERLVLGRAGVPPEQWGQVAFYDLASNFITLFNLSDATAMNRRAQVIFPNVASFYLRTIGGIGDGLTIVIPGLRPGTGDRFGRGYTALPIGLDDAGNVLGTLEGEPFLSMTTTAQFLTQRFPGSARAISPGGEVLAQAGRDSIFIWSPANGTRRVIVDSGPWTIDEVTKLNDRGDIIGHATNLQTGQRGAIVLSPVGGRSLSAR